MPKPLRDCQHAKADTSKDSSTRLARLLGAISTVSFTGARIKHSRFTYGYGVRSESAFKDARSTFKDAATVEDITWNIISSKDRTCHLLDDMSDGTSKIGRAHV